jgi:hypothetical protein
VADSGKASANRFPALRRHVTIKNITVISVDVEMQEKTSIMHTIDIYSINTAQYEADAIKNG